MARTTTAAICRAPEFGWELTEIALEAPKSYEVLVEFAAAGLCRSDDHITSGAAPVRYPMVGGHEGAGVVLETGPGVTRVSPGDHMVCSFLPVCGICTSCSIGRQNLCERGLHASTGKMPDETYRFQLDGEGVGGMCALGTFSRYAVVQEASCLKIPQDMPFDAAALMGCGVPTGWGSAVYAAGVRAGQTVVVLGAGGVGSNAVQGARHAGARHVVVVDPQPLKCRMATTFGATHCFEDAEAAMQAVTVLTDGRLADHAIVTDGRLDDTVVQQALAMVGKRGRVTVTATGHKDAEALSFHPSALLGYERTVRGALFGSCNPLYDIPRLIRFYQEGVLKVDELITRHYRLEDINQAYTDLREGRLLRGVIIHDRTG